MTEAGSVDALDLLEARLRGLAAAADPVPDLVLESARAAFTLRTLDAELAELVHDSAIDADLVLVRGPGEGDVRMLSFEHGTVAVDLQVSETAGGRELLGLVSGAVGDVEVEQAGRRTTVALDEAGRFVLEGLAAGPLRLHLSAEDGTSVETSWVTL
jgi:hypothetical protein